MAKLDNLHWRIFLSLEEELCSTQNFVDFNHDNKDTYSIKFRSIILQSCAEIEKILSLICKCKQRRIEKYVDHFSAYHAEFRTTQIETYTYEGIISPWDEWPKTPPFWTAYNDIKHNGKFETATLENAIYALAGLFAVLLFWINVENDDFPVCDPHFPPPKLFYYDGIKNFPAGTARKKFKMPGCSKKP